MDDLVQSAIQLKQHEVDQLRPRFKAAPMYLQGTLFHPTEVTVWRGRPYKERLGEATRLRQQGSDAMREIATGANNDLGTRHGLYKKALQAYEQAYGLFVYIEGRREDWKKMGIRDEDIRFVDFSNEEAENESTRGEVNSFVVGTLCNYSICANRMDMKEVGESALLEANRRDATHLRAAYLLAKALTTKPSSCSNDVIRAMAALSTALDASRHSERDSVEHIEDASSLLEALRAEREKIEAVERRAASKFIHKPSPQMQESPPSSRAIMTDDKVDSSNAEKVQNATPPSAGGPTADKAPSAALNTEGTWKDQAAVCRRVINQLRQANKIEEAISLEQQLCVAAADKLFVEVLRPRSWFDVDAIRRSVQGEPSSSTDYTFSELVTYCSSLSIDLNNPEILAQLQRRISRHMTEDMPLQWMTILEVEMELFSLGLITSTEFNDQDAMHRHNELFVARTLPDGKMGGNAILAGLSPEYIVERESLLRGMLKNHRCSTYGRQK